MNYPKAYTVKEWKKFDKLIDGSEIGNNYQYFNFFTQKMESFESVTVQEIMLQKYDIILTDYKTKKEKLFKIIDVISAKNINSGITKFNKGMDQFSKVIGQSQPKSSKSKTAKLGISQRDYDKLFKSKKTKSVNFWDEDRKTRKRRNKKRKPVQKEPDYSALIGKRKVKFF